MTGPCRRAPRGNPTPRITWCGENIATRPLSTDPPFRNVWPLDAPVAAQSHSAGAQYSLRPSHRLGPDAPRLSQGWRTVGLAAHLVCVATPGQRTGLVSPSWPTTPTRCGRHARHRHGDAGRDRSTAPPLLLRPFDGPMNTIEFLSTWRTSAARRTAREPRGSSELAEALSTARGREGSRTGRHHGDHLAGAAGDKAAPGRCWPVRDPGELAMFGARRQGATIIEVAGDGRARGELTPRSSVSGSRQADRSHGRPPRLTRRGRS